MILGRPDALNWTFEPQPRIVNQLVDGGQILNDSLTVKNDLPIKPSSAVGDVLSILPTNEIEEVLDYQVSETGPKFLIKWKGLSQEYNTWEPLRNMEKCKTLPDKLVEEQGITAKRCSLTQNNIADKTRKLVRTAGDAGLPTRSKEVDKKHHFMCVVPDPDAPTQSQEDNKTHKLMCKAPDSLKKFDPQIQVPVADSPKRESQTARISSEVKVNKFKCALCTKSFSWSHSLTRHMKIHSEGDNRPFKCTICAAAFRRKHHLKTHTRRHTGEKPFMCQDCSKTFIKKSQLTRHRMIHTGEKPFQCTECPRRFADRWTWTNHKRVHTGEKPFSCHVCGKAYMSNQSLKKHMHAHKASEIKRYPCVLCSKKFKSKRRLLKHQKSTRCLMKI